MSSNLGEMRLLHVHRNTENAIHRANQNKKAVNHLGPTMVTRKALEEINKNKMAPVVSKTTGLEKTTRTEVTKKITQPQKEKPTKSTKTKSKVPFNIHTNNSEQVYEYESKKKSLVEGKEYTNEIYKYLLEIEQRDMVQDDFLKKQEFTEKMRVILVDWLADVHNHFRLEQETLQIAVSIMDRFIDRDRTVNRDTAQLIGVTALFIAAKYEEIDPIDVTELVFICDGSLEEKSIIDQELKILQALDFNMSHPTPLFFVRRFIKFARSTPMEYTFAKYFADIALLESNLSHVRPSILAAAIVYLALSVSQERNEKSTWTEDLIQCSSYRFNDFQHVLPILSSAVVKNAGSQYHSIRRKYSNANYYYVSIMPCCQPPRGIINQFCQQF